MNTSTLDAIGSTGGLVVAVLTALVNEVGLDGIVKLISEIGGADKVKALLDAEYLASDLAADTAELVKLENETKP